MTKSHIQKLYLLAFVLSVPPDAWSQEPTLSSEYKKCLIRAEAIDPKILDCMSEEFSRQDKKLNIIYKNLLGHLEAPRKKELQETQRLWLKYTEANCKFYYPKDGGSLDRQVAFQCSIDARALRASELESILEQ